MGKGIMTSVIKIRLERWGEIRIKAFKLGVIQRYRKSKASKLPITLV